MRRAAEHRADAKCDAFDTEGRQQPKAGNNR
jgi:hypothetical protein